MEVQTGLMTAEEFYDFVHRPENQGRSFELERGRVVELPPASKYHGFVCGSVARVLWSYAAQRKKGYLCCNDAGLIVQRDPDTVRGPDVTFYEDGQTAETMDRKYSETVPRLVVEVLSPNDRFNRVLRRIGQYHARGVPLVWIIDPEERTVAVCRHGEEQQVLDEGDQLTGNSALPEFTLPVPELFLLPGQSAGAGDGEPGA